jgi:hypothetical protein
MVGQPHMWPCQERVWSQEHTGVGITGTATDKDVLQIQTVTVQTDGGSCPATGIILCEEGRTRFATAIRERRRKLETTEWCVGWSGPRLPMTPYRALNTNGLNFDKKNSACRGMTVPMIFN